MFFCLSLRMVSAFMADAAFMGGEEEDCWMNFKITK
jgi:hypothetical protein